MQLNSASAAPYRTFSNPNAQEPPMIRFFNRGNGSLPGPKASNQPASRDTLNVERQIIDTKKNTNDNSAKTDAGTKTSNKAGSREVQAPKTKLSAMETSSALTRFRDSVFNPSGEVLSSSAANVYRLAVEKEVSGAADKEYTQARTKFQDDLKKFIGRAEQYCGERGEGDCKQVYIRGLLKEGTESAKAAVANNIKPSIVKNLDAVGWKDYERQDFSGSGGIFETRGFNPLTKKAVVAVSSSRDVPISATGMTITAIAGIGFGWRIGKALRHPVIGAGVGLVAGLAGGGLAAWRGYLPGSNYLQAANKMRLSKEDAGNKALELAQPALKKADTDITTDVNVAITDSAFAFQPESVPVISTPAPTPTYSSGVD